MELPFSYYILIIYLTCMFLDDEAGTSVIFLNDSKHTVPETKWDALACG